jgi:hypothetical protein
MSVGRPKAASQIVGVQRAADAHSLFRATTPASRFRRIRSTDLITDAATSVPHTSHLRADRADGTIPPAVAVPAVTLHPGVTNLAVAIP